MSLRKIAIIKIVSLEEGTHLIFRHNIAGLSIFKRLILSLQRASIENFIIIAQDIPTSDMQWVKSDIQNDLRFKSNIKWNNLSKNVSEDELILIGSSLGNDSILFVESNLVTTSGLVKDFLMATQGLHTGEAAGLFNEAGQSDGIYLLPFSGISKYLYLGVFEKPLTSITLTGPWLYRQRLKDLQSVKSVENNLLNEHKLYYRQFMDVWFNSLFSVKISSFLVKTPITPNQISLFGLFIGMASGILFAQGNYLSSFIGALLLVFTAIWDCCDGDVARLKFLESDFGEKLDTTCDNIINIFIFTGMMIGVAHSKGITQAIVPFFLLTLGGCLIFYLIYFPKGGKGSFFKNTLIYDVIQILASRNFIYIIFVFAIIDKLSWFLWLAGIGSNIFALIILIAKRKIILSTVEKVKK